MRKSILILGVVMAVWSCKKTGSTTVTKRLTSVSHLARAQLWHIKEVDTILYDNNNRMVEFRRMSFDTSFNLSGFLTGIGFSQATFVFSYLGSDSLPSSYVLTAFGNPFPHLLTYNNLKQPIKDSNIQTRSSVHFSYAPNFIVAMHVSPTVLSENRTDSFVLQNGNSAWLYYKFPYDSQSNSVDQMNYSNLPNPLCNFKGLSTVLYAMLPQNFDWISKNLYTSRSNSNNPGNMLMMTWGTDASGNVISGDGGNITASIKMAFTYQ